MRITYQSNNSGGQWWLTDDNWRALEAAGWTVQWGGLYYCGEQGAALRIFGAPEGKPQPCMDRAKCEGHRKCESAEEAAKGRYLGALAKAAFKDFETPGDAIREFERVTGAQASKEGCGCCGAPHGFHWEGGYASGNGVLPYLFKKVPGSLREAAESMNRGEH